MAKKNMGKVKRYRRSFYSGRQRVARIAGGIGALAVLFVVGWLVGPAVIDFGTSTWYAITRDRPKQEQQEQTSSEASASQSTSSEAAATPQPTQEPQTKEDLTQGTWTFVDTTALTSQEAIDALVQNLASQGVRYAVVTLKDNKGNIYYNSALEAAAAGISSSAFDAQALAKALQSENIVPVAAICVFKDPIAASANRSMAVMYQNSEYLWLDAALNAGGKPWLNPYSEEAQAFITGLMQEARQMGYEQIWLSGVQFPTKSGRDKASYGDTAGVSEAERLKQLIEAWQAEGTCWIEYPLSVASGQDVSLTGGTIDALGIENLAIRVSGTLTEETQQQLEQAKTTAANAAYIGVYSNDSFTVEEGKG